MTEELKRDLLNFTIGVVFMIGMTGLALVLTLVPASRPITAIILAGGITWWAITRREYHGKA